MDYVFFDIECANCDGGNGKICSFGYTILNSNLQMTEKRDIIINPRAPFRLRGHGKKAYITLAYSEEVFKNSPDFTAYYKFITELLTAENRLIFGYAPENDAGFLRSEFERYSLPEADFVFYDVQRLYKYASGIEVPNLCSLSSACEGLGISTEFTEHKSCDDAFATMNVLLKLCEINNMRPEELVEKFHPCKGELKDDEITADYFKPKIELKPGEENYLKGPNSDKFKQIVRKINNKNEHGMLYGKKIAFSRNYEYNHFTEMCCIVRLTGKKGGRYTNKISSCDIFVKQPESFMGTCKRLIDAKNIREQSGNVKPEIMSFSAFLSIIGIKEKNLPTYKKN